MKIHATSLSQHVRDLWNQYELSTLILLSLFLQMFLALFGNRRKYGVAKWLSISIWLAYLSADWVATLSLGILARSQGESDNKNSDSTVPAFSAPILILHLGGPDTITAYSSEDNELWLRHLLELVTQVIIAVYTLIRSWWSKEPLIYVAIPIFVAGMIKYGERNWVLRSANSQNLRESTSQILKESESGEPKDATLRTELTRMTHLEFFDLTVELLNNKLGFNAIKPEAKFLHEAYWFFEMFKVLVAGLVLKDFEHLASYLLLSSKSAAEAFKLIEVELGFMFDVLYTKFTRIQCSRLIFRAISFLCSVSALLAFSISVNRVNHLPYSTVDLSISFILLVGAIFNDIYTATVLVLSDWAMLLGSKQNKRIVEPICRIICSFSYNQKRWINSLAQHNLLQAAFPDEERKENVFMRLLGSGHIQSWEEKSNGLEELIFNELKDKRSRYSLRMVHNDPGKSDLTEILAERGGQVLEREECPEDLNWSVVHSDFNQSILTWHIATDLCYYDDFYKKWNRDADRVHPSCKRSRTLSNYMVYLLCDRPSFLPAGVGEVRYKLAFNDLTGSLVCRTYFNGVVSGQKVDWNSGAAIERLLGTTSDIPKLSASCELAASLQSLEPDHRWDNRRKWEMISGVWVEMLTYAASRCAWKEHVHALTRGGELLTHVCLLMAHLGLHEQCLNFVSDLAWRPS